MPRPLVPDTPGKERLHNLLAAVHGADRALIVPHNDPDPDAIASSAAMRFLLTIKAGLECRLAFRGLIGRAENKALVKYLGCPFHILRDSDYQDAGTALIFIDTQPGAGNNPVPLKYRARVVIDHHPRRPSADTAVYTDIRTNGGTCSTIMTGYLREADLEPDPQLATALFYGIQTDTRSLSRDVTPSDSKAYFYLQTRVDVEALAEIENAQVPAEYFRSLSATLNAVRIYRDVVMVYIGNTTYPDIAAEMADFLLRLERIRWVICMDTFKETLFISVRTRDRRGGADDLIEDMIGMDGTYGGHEMTAGGQVPLNGRAPQEVVSKLQQRALSHLGIPPDLSGTPLI